LKKVKASMTDEDLAELARATQELRLKQETPDPPEALRSVPSLSLLDIPKEPIRIPTEVVLTFSILCLNVLNLLLSCWRAY
jgi:Zn-dependent M16 (insulinase) family peptidase